MTLQHSPNFTSLDLRDVNPIRVYHYLYVPRYTYGYLLYEVDGTFILKTKTVQNTIYEIKIDKSNVLNIKFGNMVSLEFPLVK